MNGSRVESENAFHFMFMFPIKTTTIGAVKAHGTPSQIHRKVITD